MDFKVEGCIDLPDIRDYNAEELLSANDEIDINNIHEVEEKEEVNMKNIYPNNQGRTNACTAFGLSNLRSIQLQLEQKKSPPEFNATQQWTNQLKYGTASEQNGDYLQSALKTALHYTVSVLTADGWEEYAINQYQRVQRGNIKRWLSMGKCIYTGLKLKKGVITRDASLDKHFFKTEGENYCGHCVIIIGYTKEGHYIIMNSWGQNWADRGTALLHKDDIRTIMTPYIVY